MTGYRILSKERREGNCSVCGDYVYEMAFVKDENKKYRYICYDCLSIGESKRKKDKIEILKIDEKRLAREEVVRFLLHLAEEDEKLFEDQRLTVVKTFKDEIIEGIINEKLEKYIRFNGNDINEVMKLRNFAVEAIKREGKKFRELVDLYKQSRIRKLTSDQRNRIKILLTDKDIQCLFEDYKIVWDHLVDIKKEVEKPSSLRRYDNLREIKEVLRFLDRKGYMTEKQLKRLRSFYYEMMRRNKKNHK